MRRSGERWVRRQVRPVGPVEVTHARPWATVARVPVATGQVWFKRCAPVQAFEPRLTAALAERWPHLLPDVIAVDDRRGWLLLGDAGIPVRDLGNPPEPWLDVLPVYAELQRGEVSHVDEHLAGGVPDLRVPTLPERLPELLTGEAPLSADERALLGASENVFARWCAELAAGSVQASVQHDDLHHANLHLHDGRPCVLDWGDSCISHPFASLVVTFQFLEEVTGLSPGDPWFARLRDAYLEPWGSGHREELDLAMRVGIFAHAISWLRYRRALPQDWKARFDKGYRAVLERVLAHAAATPSLSATRCTS